ncbi:hypothetical protein F441_09393 [Phytophthora nicotianae CJ01A1]|uniref:Uncharacterized protein n=4 Tax=Phytophthora nicotianae TaxID=4792 RepID=V9F3Q1_PHYNI|nr:hypothetical protein F443_09434 [Phytophthora nicotianae P1569]ETK86094.1 hypothetical protein L915_09253 [Phytophthora nicotianae]ETL29150.1 hypothetical protein L916_17609 [Phytophthora nicotianae]ETL82369.1 hypothetical protein L917_17455 [Phytophthora nicotianae]ETP15969.1 hypothetical protein F441_09393 [Phytophthora nicotianae CJ01A1]
MLESDTNWDCSSDDEETLADESMPRSYIDSVNVRLRVDDIDELLLRKARDEVGAVLLRLRLCMFGASPSDPALVELWLSFYSVTPAFFYDPTAMTQARYAEIIRA